MLRKAVTRTRLQLNFFLTERHRILGAVESFRSANRMAEVLKINSFTTRIVPVLKVCHLCSRKNHTVRICPRHLQMTVNDRSPFIQGKQLCYNCFASNHQFRDCTSAHNCLTCQNRYHTLIHRNSGLFVSFLVSNGYNKVGEPPRSNIFFMNSFVHS